MQRCREVVPQIVERAGGDCKVVGCLGPLVMQSTAFIRSAIIPLGDTGTLQALVLPGAGNKMDYSDATQPD